VDTFEFFHPNLRTKINFTERFGKITHQRRRGEKKCRRVSKRSFSKKSTGV
jgi:hypothetical protein